MAKITDKARNHIKNSLHAYATHRKHILPIKVWLTSLKWVKEHPTAFRELYKPMSGNLDGRVV